MGITCRVDSNKKCNEESARAAAGDTERKKERKKQAFRDGRKKGFGWGVASVGGAASVSAC